MIKYLNNIFFKDESKHFDYIILTHTDSDHMGNIDSILANFSFDEIYLPRNIVDHESYSSVYDKIISNKNKKVSFNTAGYEVLLGNNSYIKWLSPSATTYSNENDYSAITLVGVNGYKFLFTGDASTEIENIMLFNYDITNIDVLKAGHHGSKGSTSLDLLLEANPKNIVFSVGKNNYGHPSNEVIERIYKYQLESGEKVALHNTQNNGNLIFKVGNDLSITSIANINRYFFIDWWVVVLLFVIMFSCWFILFRKYAINRVYQNSKEMQKKKKI